MNTHRLLPSEEGRWVASRLFRWDRKTEEGLKARTLHLIPNVREQTPKPALLPLRFFYNEVEKPPPLENKGRSL